MTQLQKSIYQASKKKTKKQEASKQIINQYNEHKLLYKRRMFVHQKNKHNFLINSMSFSFFFSFL